MGIYTKEEQFKLIHDNPYNLEKIDNQYEDVCLEAVKNCGWSLKYIKDQTKEICLEAIKEGRYNIEHGYVFQYVKEQTEDICIEVVKQNGYAIQLVKDKTPILCFYAFLQNYDLLNVKDVKNGINKFIESKYRLENKILYMGKYRDITKNYISFDFDSLVYLKQFLLKENSSNTYICEDIYIEVFDLKLFKELALSNNKLIIIDTGNIKDVYRILANKIITIEELEKGSF